MSLLSSLLILIVAARLLGQIFVRINQPAVIGEMLGGILLGPAVLGIVHPTPSLAGVSDLAVFLVIVAAGLEMRFEDVVAAMKGAGLRVALLSFFIPFLPVSASPWRSNLTPCAPSFWGCASRLPRCRLRRRFSKISAC